MKTLKKTLCLVLALVMAFSLMSVAFAGNFDNYTDADKVGDAYVEAVDVLLGLGIVNGDSATTLSPQGYYTREQAAKIATYIAVGPKVADMLSASSDPFTDVKADRWSAGYIAYCARENILNGLGDGTFNPTGYVTGYQFAKMILAAAGYGKNGEFTGSGWEIAVAQLALSDEIDLFAGDASAATSKPITREQAMLIAFNALFVELVKYSKDTESYIGTETYFNKNYGIDKKDATEAGVDGYKWALKNGEGDVISGFYSDESVVATFEGGTKYSAVLSKLGIKSTSTKTADLYRNGVLKEEDIALASLVGVNEIIPYGVTLTVLKNGDNYKFMASIEYFAEVTGTSKAKNLDGEYEYSAEFSVYGMGATVKIDVDMEKGEYEKGEYYAVVPKGDNTASDELLEINELTVIENKKIDKYSTSAPWYMVIGGSKYFASTVAIYNIADDENLTNYYNFYIGTTGALLAVEDYAEAEASSYEYAYVVATQSKAAADEDLYSGSAAATAKASVIFTDGTKKTVDLAIGYADIDADSNKEYYVTLPNGSKQEVATETGITGFGTGWLSYTVNSDGEYKFAALNANYATVDTATLVKGKADIGVGKYLNSKSVITLIDKDLKVTTVTGLPTAAIAGEYSVLFTYAKGSNIIVNVYSVNAEIAEEETVTYAYAISEGAYVPAEDAYEMTFAIDGKQVTYLVAADCVDDEGDPLYDGYVYDLTVEDGVVTSAIYIPFDYEELKIASVDSSYVLTDGGLFYFASKTAAYDISEAADVIGEAATLADDLYVNLILNTDDEIVVAYIVDEPVNSSPTPGI